MNSLIISQKRAKNSKNDQILTLHKPLASFFTKRPIQVLPNGSHYSESPTSLLPTELVQTLTVTHTQIARMQEKSFSPKRLNELLPI